MITLGTAQVTSPASPEAFFDRWADMDTWPEWNTDTEWVRLRGPFRQGARGQLKPKGAPRVGFEVTALVPGKEFTDVTKLIGARLTFRHVVTATPEGATRVDVTVTMRGPLGRVWAKALGAGIAKSLQGDLDRLAAAAESPRRPTPPSDGGGEADPAHPATDPAPDTATDPAPDTATDTAPDQDAGPAGNAS